MVQACNPSYLETEAGPAGQLSEILYQNKIDNKGWECSSVVAWLASLCEALGSIPSNEKKKKKKSDAW